MKNIVIVLIVVVIFAMAFFAWPIYKANELAKKISNSFSTALNTKPTIIINNTTIITGTTKTAELATCMKSIYQVTQYSTTQYKITRTVEIFGQATVKAGCDLSKVFEIIFDDKGIIIRIANPKILSVELGNISFRSGGVPYFWPNNANIARTAALKQFQEEARASAIKSNIFDEAKRNFDDLIKEKNLMLGKPFSIQWVNNDTKPN